MRIIYAFSLVQSPCLGVAPEFDVFVLRNWSCFMDLFPLLNELSNGAYHSGARLGEALGISRAAIWKQVERLRAMGVEVHSVTGKGYRLPQGLKMLTHVDILKHLGEDAHAWKDRLTVLFSTTSTNAEVLSQYSSRSDHCVVVAEHQTQGRGRRGRTWVSPVGANIYFSMSVEFESGVAAVEGLSLVVGLSLLRALDSLGCAGVGLKWPNDLLVDGKKIAGVLLEMTGDVTGPCNVVIGIGLNVKMPQSFALDIGQPYTDLCAHMRDAPDRNRVVATMIKHLDAALEIFRAEGFEPFRQEWEARDVYSGCMVELSAGRSSLQGRVAGLTSAVGLRLDTVDGEKVVTGGEILPSLRPVLNE